MEIKFDIEKDYLKIIKKILTNEFNVTGLPKTFEDTLLLFFTLDMRKIKRQKRTIVEADTFLCPSQVYDGYSQLKNAIENGDDINKYQSKKLKEHKFNDPLLFHWNIYHLHLGTITKNDGFIARTGPLLYAMINDKTFYSITIEEHGKWENIDLIEVINRNWPHLFIGKFQGQLAFNPTEKDIKTLRNSRINSTIKIDNYNILPALGVTMKGTPVDSTMKLIHLKKAIQRVEDIIKSNTEVINEELHNISDSADEYIQCKLIEITYDGFVFKAYFNGDSKNFYEFIVNPKK